MINQILTWNSLVMNKFVKPIAESNCDQRNKHLKSKLSS